MSDLVKLADEIEDAAYYLGLRSNEESEDALTARRETLSAAWTAFTAEAQRVGAECDALRHDLAVKVELLHDAQDKWAKAVEREDALRAQVERMRTALGIFADDESWRYGRRLDPQGSRFDGTEIARRALASEVKP